MENVFEGINLEDLETGNAESSKVESITTFVENKEGVSTETKETIIPEELGIDLDVLSGLTDEVEETTVEKTTKDDTKETPGKTEQSLSSQNMLSSLTSALVETGVLSSLSEEEVGEIKDTESLLKAVEKQIKKNELADLSEEQKSYLEAVRAGVDAKTYVDSKSVLAQYKALTEDQIENNENLQFELLKRNFLVKGFDDKDAIKYAKLAYEAEDSIEEAKLALNSLVAHEEKVLQEKIDSEKANKQKQIEAETAKLEELKSKINTASDIIPGIKINSLTKEKVFESMTNIVKVDGANNYNEVMDAYKNDPDYKVKLHAIHVATKGFTDFSKFEKTTKSKAVMNLKEQLDQQGTASSGASPSFGRGTVSKGILDALSSTNF